ncbi:MAG: MlaD family protein [Porticoccaceae bacterium]
METRAHHIIIGFFTLAVTIAAIVFALWLTKTSGDQNTRRYDIVFTESVTGLSVGSNVLYNGIRIGEVTSLNLDTDDPRKIWARIRIADNVPVTTATRARLTIANITGAAIIQLLSGPPGNPPLKADGDKVPVIQASPSPFSQLRSSSEELLVNISQLVTNASKILSEDNSRHFSNILANIDSATSAFAGEKDAISQGLKDMAKASEELHKTLSQAATLMAKMNSGIDTHGDQLLGDAQKTLHSLEQLSTNLNAVIAANKGALDQSIQGFSEVGPLIQELRTTLDSLGEVSRRLEEDPSGYLFGSEKIKEFEP